MKINYKATSGGWIGASASTGLNSTPTNTRSDWDIDTSHDENPAQSDWVIDTSLHKLCPIGLGRRSKASHTHCLFLNFVF